MITFSILHLYALGAFSLHCYQATQYTVYRASMCRPCVSNCPSINQAGFFFFFLQLFIGNLLMKEHPVQPLQVTWGLGHLLIQLACVLCCHLDLISDVPFLAHDRLRLNLLTYDMVGLRELSSLWAVPDTWSLDTPWSSFCIRAKHHASRWFSNGVYNSLLQMAWPFSRVPRAGIMNLPLWFTINLHTIFSHHWHCQQYRSCQILWPEWLDCIYHQL